ncbi:MAG: glycyl radical protein [Moorellales bacterium]
MEALQNLNGSIRLSDRHSERIDRLVRSIRRERFPLCMEKARLITESYRQTEGEPEILRAAKAWAHLLERFPIFIQDDECIVGEGASKPWGVELDPFLGVWDEGLIRDAERDGVVEVAPEDWELIRELGSYWKTRSVEYQRGKRYSQRIWEFLQLGVTLPPMEKREEFRGPYAGSGLCLYFNFTDGRLDYERWLGGLNNILREIREELEALRILSVADAQKRLFLEGAAIVLEAIKRLAARYGELAASMAASEENPARKSELLKIAEACRWVPANRPRSFYEAMQSFWFLQLVSTPTSTQNLGRFDQFMYPFYRADWDKGELSDEDVLALLCELRVKCMRPENIKISPQKRMQHGGFAKWRVMTIGGVTPEGNDATNELTYLALEAASRVRTPHHTIALRVHEGTPMALMVKALEVVRTGIGMPAFASDRSYIEYFLAAGVPLEEARNYHIVGCVDPAIPGKVSALAGYFFVLPKVLEIFLNGGVDPRTGIELCPYKVDPNSFTTYEDFFKAFKEYLAYFIALWTESMYIAPEVLYYHYFVENMLMHDRIQVGKSFYEHPGAYPYNFCARMIPVGIMNVVDSLAVVKKLIFEDRKLSMEELIEALKANWNGFEEVRKMCMSAPKYGNDDDYVDGIAKELFRFIVAEEAKYRGVNGARVCGVGGASITSMWPGGAVTGATPDGRRAGEVVADGTVSPVQGRDSKGPTAVLKSASKIDQVLCASTLLNMRFHPSALKSEDDLRKLAMLIKTYFNMGGKWIQFNVVSRETLLDAQQNPEKYQDLVVRVAGYSAYFVQLGKALQDDIIARTEHDLR